MFFDSVETKEVELKNCLDTSKPLSEYKRLFFTKGANKETKNKRKWAGVINYRKNTTSICEIKHIYLYYPGKYFRNIYTIVVC